VLGCVHACVAGMRDDDVFYLFLHKQKSHECVAYHGFGELVNIAQKNAKLFCAVCVIQRKTGNSTHFQRGGLVCTLSFSASSIVSTTVTPYIWEPRNFEPNDSWVFGHLSISGAKCL
jgi:hypothetical protein